MLIKNVPSRWRLPLLSVATASLPAAGSAPASLIGDSVTGSTFSELWDVTVDLSATTLAVSAHENTSGPSNFYSSTNTLFGIVLGDLDLGSGITGLRLVSGGSTWIKGHGTSPVFATTTSARGIAIDWHALDFGAGNILPNGGSWNWDIEYIGAATEQTVPEPTSAALVLLALLGRLPAAGGRPETSPGTKVASQRRPSLRRRALSPFRSPANRRCWA